MCNKNISKSSLRVVFICLTDIFHRCKRCLKGCDEVKHLSSHETNDNMSLVDAVTFPRHQLVPAGYHPYPFRTDTDETFLDKLRSITATFRYRKKITRKKGWISLYTCMFLN